MSMLNGLAKIVAKPIPRAVSPRIHGMVDYVSVGAFIAGAAMFWGRNKRAALASLICGGAELASVLLTDYPGDGKKPVGFRTHCEMDYGLAAIVATMPETLAFERTGEKKFFRVQGALITLLGEVTNTGAINVGRSRSRAA